MTTETPCETTNTSTPADAGSAILPTTTGPDGLTLQSLECRVKLVEIETSVDDLLTLDSNLSFMAGQIKSLRDELNKRMIEWINKHGPITIGTRTIYVGEDKTTKCKDVKAAMQALLEASDGDWDRVVQCLSANAIKHGAAKAVLEGDWDTHFEVVKKAKLEEGEEKPVKKIVDMDTQWIKKKGTPKQ